jgi:hypothetical protein
MSGRSSHFYESFDSLDVRRAGHRSEFSQMTDHDSTYENAITTLSNYMLFILPNRLTTSLPPLLFRMAVGRRIFMSLSIVWMSGEQVIVLSSPR